VDEILVPFEAVLRAVAQMIYAITNGIVHGGILQIAFNVVLILVLLCVYLAVLRFMFRFTGSWKLTQGLDPIEARRMARQLEAFRVEPGDVPDYPRPLGMAPEVWISQSCEEIITGDLDAKVARETAVGWRIEMGLSTEELAELEKLEPFRRWNSP
jgi:hypothetical protein